MSHLRSLYICYLPLSEPLVRTQVVPYLKGLAAAGHKMHLLTFERDKLSARQKRFERRRLKHDGITWHTLPYHNRPSLPATMYDVGAGTKLGLRLIRRYHLNVVHVRNHVPAAMGAALKRLTGCRLIFDMRGLMAEEREDAGFWTRDSLPFRLTKSLEKKCLANADGIIVLTERVRRHLFGTQEPGAPLRVIPCCADLSHIEAQSGERAEMREKLKLEDKIVLTYIGKFDGWYMQAEMADFFAAARTVIPNLHFLILTQSDPELIRKELTRNNVKSDDFTLTRAEPGRVGAYLAAADVAISFIAAFPSKIASSPTKIGEYLAAGLPIVCNVGVGDVDAIIENYRAGVLVKEFDAFAYQNAARRVIPLIGDADTFARCQQAAHETASLQEIGIPRYQELYAEVASHKP